MFIFCDAIGSIYIGGFFKEAHTLAESAFSRAWLGTKLCLTWSWQLLWGRAVTLLHVEAPESWAVRIRNHLCRRKRKGGKRSQCYSTAEPYTQIRQLIPSSYLCVPCAQAGSLKTVTQNHQSGQSYRPDWTGWCSVKIRKTIMGLSYSKIQQ